MARYTGGVTAACFLLIGIASHADPPAFQSLTEAEAHYHAQLVEHPDQPLPRLELARTYFLQGRDTLAQEHFERVLASDPPPTVKTNIHRFLDRIRARRKWSASVGFSIAPDSNLEGQSETRTIKSQCRGLLVLVCKDGVAEGTVQASQPTSGTGLQVWAAGEYQHPLSDPIRLRFGGRMDRTEHKGHHFDKMTLSAHTGPRWLLNPQFEVSLLAIARRHYVANNNPQYRDLGLRLEAHHRLDQRTRIGLQVERAERDYDHRTTHDGPLTNVTARVSHVLTPTVRINGLLGWSRKKPHRIASRNTGWQASAGVSVLLPKGFTLGGIASISTTEYEGTRYDVFDESNREDETQSVSVSLHRRDFTVMGFSPEVSVTKEKRVSNAQLAGYKRWSGGLSFVRPF